MEYLDIVDENGFPTGEIVERDYAHLNGVMHRTSHVWLLRKRNEEIEVLLQERCSTKKTYPGCLDISSAGHIPSGVDFIPSALRELKEELGIEVNADELIPIGHRIIKRDGIFFNTPFHDRQYSNIYILWCNKNEDEFTLQKEELSAVKWFNLDKCIEAVKNNTIKHCICIDEILMIKEAVNR